METPKRRGFEKGLKGYRDFCRAKAAYWAERAEEAERKALARVSELEVEAAKLREEIEKKTEAV